MEKSELELTIFKSTGIGIGIDPDKSQFHFFDRPVINLFVQKLKSQYSAVVLTARRDKREIDRQR